MAEATRSKKAAKPNKAKKAANADRPKYHMWQNTGFLIATAWRVRKQVLFLCLSIALVTAAQSIAEMLIAPVLLGKVEAAVPWTELVTAILLFSALLLLLAGLKGYFKENTIYNYSDITFDLDWQIQRKMARTSYPNLLDTRFINMEEKAERCRNQGSSVDITWDRWTEILSNVICFLVYLALLSGLNPLLVCLVTVTAAISYLGGNRLRQWEYRHREEEAAYNERMNYICQVASQRQPAKDIRIFGLQGWLDDIWDSTVRLYRGFLLRKGKAYIRITVLDLLLTLLRNGVAYAYLIGLTLAKGLPASEFLLYFNAISGLSEWVTGFLNAFSELHTHSMNLSVLREFLEWPEPFLFEEGEPLTGEPAGSYEIRLEDVSYRYPEADRDTLSHINLTIHPGEKLAIVGLNGAGKTTLVRLVCGFLDPTEGQVLLNGQDIRRYNRWDYYRLFSSVFQDFSVLEHTIAVNVAQCVEGIDVRRVWECLEMAGLTEKVHSLPEGIDTHLGRQVYEDGVELSGGQIQRLMLARALYKDGSIILLDEPTAALDPIAENDIYMKYNEMTDGRTSLFISHRLASTRFCDRILFLEQGQIREEGTHESLLALGGGYAGLYQVQSRYYQEGGEADGE